MRKWEIYNEAMLNPFTDLGGRYWLLVDLCHGPNYAGLCLPYFTKQR